MDQVLIFQILKSAQGYLSVGDTANAWQHCSEVLNIDPNNVISLQMGAEIAAKENKNTLAVSILSQLLLNNEGDFNIHARLSILYLKIGNLSAAIKSFEKIVEYTPDNFSYITSFIDSTLLFSEAAFRCAKFLVLTALLTDPENKELLEKYNYFLLNPNNYSSAFKIMGNFDVFNHVQFENNTLAKNLTGINVAYCTGVVAQGDIENSLNVFLEEEKRTPHCTQEVLDFCDAMELLSILGFAIAKSIVAIEFVKNPEDRIVASQQINLLTIIGKKSEANTILASIVYSEFEKFSEFYDFGVLHIKLGKEKIGKKMLLDGLDAELDIWDSHFRVADIFNVMTDGEKHVIDVCNLGLRQENSGNRKGLYNLLMKQYIKLGLSVEAVDVGKVWFKEEKNNRALVGSLLAEALLNQSRFGEATNILTATILESQGNDRLEMIATLGTIYYSLGRSDPENYTKALDVFDSGLEISSTNPRLLHQKALVLATLSDFESASDVLGRAKGSSALNFRAYQECRNLKAIFEWLIHYKKQQYVEISNYQDEDKENYFIAMVLWGDHFLDLFERYLLPSLLAAENLPYLAAKHETKLVIYTREFDLARIEKIPILARVREKVHLQIISFPDNLIDIFGGFQRDPYTVMSTVHVAALTTAKAYNANFIFLAPDIILADNFLKTIEQKRNSGKLLLFFGGIMLNEEGFRENVLPEIETDQQIISVTPKELIKLSLPHFHGDTLTNIYSKNMQRDSASVMIWPLAKEGFFMHGFNHTPFLVSKDILNFYDGAFFGTIDGEFLSTIIKGADFDFDRDFAVVQDALETNYFELSPQRDRWKTQFDQKHIVRWGNAQGEISKWLFSHRIDFNLDQNRKNKEIFWDANQFVQKVLGELDN